jgi:uncharacterized phage protein (TIGR02216 family)
MKSEVAPFPWERAMAIGLGVLRLPPDQFWRMTPREFAAALRGLYGEPATPIDRAAFETLAAKFPDHEQTPPVVGLRRAGGAERAKR